jgi:hypothetical protein
MQSRGRRSRTVTGLDGEVELERRRYRCPSCGGERNPADEAICCGVHAVTWPLAKRTARLATREHFTEIEEAVFDLLGVSLARDTIWAIVHETGGELDDRRRAEAEAGREAAIGRREGSSAEVRPRRVCVGCDGITYCTNAREPDPRRPGRNRLVWHEMKVGCVWWEDEEGRTHKRVVWGREGPEEFGLALWMLACRCGYREAEDKVFLADGAEWCWSIRERCFPEAEGVLDWYHLAEHVWRAARIVKPDDANAWAEAALDQLAAGGGEALRVWLESERRPRRGRRRDAVDALLGYVRPRLSLTEYPRHRAAGRPIGSGTVESTNKQLVAGRLKGPGMHWTDAGALALTALRAHVLNGNWHQTWRTLAS